MTRVEGVTRVLLAVEQVAWGRVASYGDIGLAAGVNPRTVGRILARHGNGVAWWRVTNREGLLPERLLAEAVVHWEEEGIALRDDGRGCDLAACRVEVSELLPDAKQVED